MAEPTFTNNNIENKATGKEKLFLANFFSNNSVFSGSSTLSSRVDSKETENMIRLRRKFDYNTRPRPKAIAILHPETKEVLFPGTDKVDQDENSCSKEIKLDEKKTNQVQQEINDQQGNWSEMGKFSQNIEDIWSGGGE